MNPLVAPTVARFTVNGTYAGRPVANVLDMAILIEGSFTERAAAIEDQANIIVSAWADHMLDLVVDNYVAQSVSWLDLNSLTGSSGATTQGTGTDFPAAGAKASDAAPGNVSLRVNKNISATRGQRQGRLYLAGFSEADSTDAAPNTVTGAAITSANTNLAAFLAAINQNGGTLPPNYDSELSVLHTHIDKPDPDDKDTWVLVYEGRSAVSTLTVDPTLASQRRRLRG